MLASATSALGRRDILRARFSVFNGKSRIACLLATLLAPVAHALSDVGSLDQTNPGDVIVTSFTLVAPGAQHSRGRMFTRLMTCLIASLGIAFAAIAEEIKVLAPNAAKESVTEAISVFEKTT